MGVVAGAAVVTGAAEGCGEGTARVTELGEHATKGELEAKDAVEEAEEEAMRR